MTSVYCESEVCQWCNDRESTKECSFNGPGGTASVCSDCYKELFAL